MTMYSGSLGMDDQIASWDTLMAAQSPSYDVAPAQDAYSYADASPWAEPAADPMYAPSANDVYSYADAAPDPGYGADSGMYAPAPDLYSTPEMYGPPAPDPWSSGLAEYVPQPAYAQQPGLGPEWQTQNEQDYYGGTPDYGADIFPPDPGSAAGNQFEFDDSGNILQRWGQPFYNPQPLSAPDMIGPPAPGLQYNQNIPLDPNQIQDMRNVDTSPVSGRMLLGGLGIMGEAPLPEQGGSYYSGGTPFDATPANDIGPIDPSLYAQFGFGSTGDANGLTDQQISDLRAGKPFFNNPQFAESNAQFDYTTDPANRQMNVDPLGWAISPIGPVADLVDKAGRNATQMLALNNQLSVPTTGSSGDGRYGADEGLVQAAFDTVIPQSPLDFALLAAGSAASWDQGPEAVIRNLLNAPADEATTALEKMPQRALNAANRRFPEAPGLASDIGNLTRKAAGASDEIPAIAKGADEGIMGAASGGETGFASSAPRPEAPGLAGNIRLAKYPDDIAGEIKQWADTNPDVIDAARRGTRSEAETLTAAKSLVEDTGGDFAKLQKEWKPGDAWNAEEITAIRGTLNSKTDEVLKAAAAVRAADTPENQAALISAIKEQARIQEVVHGVTAEAGRALQAFKADAAYLRANPDSALAQTLVKEAGFDPSKVAQVAEMILKADPTNPAKINSVIRNVKTPGMIDYLQEIWINSLLSGPTTHARNFLSNLATATLSPVERATSAAVEPVMRRIQGRATERFFQEATADAAGAVTGIPEGLQSALYTITHGGVRPGEASKIEFPHAFGGKAGNIIRAPSTMLEASDALHSAINYRAAIGAEAVRAARKEGLSGEALIQRIAELKANPTDEMTKAAKAIADYRVFRAPPGEWTKAIMSAREKITPLKFVIPFIKTPVNLMKFGIERSPLGLLDPSLWRNVKAGNAVASDQIARAIVGSSIAAGVALQVAGGNITGAVPSLSSARDRFYREGKQPFSIKIGDQWVSYQQMEPFNQTFSQIASAVDSIKNGGSADSKVTKALSTIGTNLVSQSYMTGLSDALNAIQDPERYGSQWASRMASGFVPFSSALRTIDRAVDPKIRDAQGLKETLMSSIPGLSDNLPARLDAFGNQIDRASPFYSPINVSAEKQTAVDAELERVGAEVGFVGKSIGGRKLNEAEQRDYQGVAGQITYQLLNELIALPEYQGLSDDEKQAAIEDAVSQARTWARDALKANNYRAPAGVR